MENKQKTVKKINSKTDTKIKDNNYKCMVDDITPIITISKVGEISPCSNRKDKLSTSFQDIEPEYEPNFKMVPYRWVVLILFCIYLFAAGQNVTYIQPVSKSIARAYNITNSQINLSITCFSIANILNFF